MGTCVSQLSVQHFSREKVIWTTTVHFAMKCGMDVNEGDSFKV